MNIPCALYCPDQLTSYTVITGRLVASSESVYSLFDSMCIFSVPMGLFE